MKCCHFWSPAHVFPLKRVSGCSQICLTEHILWACCSENRILIQIALVKRNIQNSCFICAWSPQKWEEPRQTSVCKEVSVSGARFGHSWKQSVGHSICFFRGTRRATNQLQKPFIFDLFIADSFSQDLPCNSARNLERSQTFCTALGQQMLEQMKPGREEWAATGTSEQQREEEVKDIFR